MTYNQLMQKPGKRINPTFFYFQDGKKIEILHDSIKESKPFFNASLIGTIMKGLKAELDVELPNVAIYFENTVRYGTNSATKTIGPYYLKEKPDFNADSKTYTHNLYDNFISTMVDYKPITITYPCTVLDFFKRLCVECGFTTNITSLPNGSRILDHDIYDGINFTYRDVFDDIGKATATLFKININNIEKCNFGTSSVTINDNILKNQNIALGKHFGPINSVVLARAGDSDKIYKRDESLTEWNEIKISDNQLMNDNNRSDYLDELYNALHGIEYDIFDLELVGYGGFEPLQKVTIKTGEKTYSSYIFNNEEVYTQGYTESIFTELPEENVTDYKKSDTTDRRIDQVYIIANKQNQTIAAFISKVDNSEKEFNTKFEMTSQQINSVVNSISEQESTINNITQTINETTNQISETGGSNLLLNTRFYQNADEWEKSDNASFEVLLDDQDFISKTESKTAIKMKNGSISQQFSTIIGQQYTLSFKYKKAGINVRNSQIYLMIGSKKIDIFSTASQVNNITEFSYTYNATTTSPVIYIETNNDDFYVSDLIVQTGTSKIWSPNPSETRGLGHKLTRDELELYDIASSGESVKMTPNSLRYYQNNNQVTEYSKNRMNTPYAEIEQGKIGNITITKVGNDITLFS